MNKTHRDIYLQKARDVAAGRIVLLRESPAHVPVLAQDLIALLEEYEDLLQVELDNLGGIDPSKIGKL